MEYAMETLRSDWEASLRLAPRIAYAVVVLGMTMLVSTAAGRLAGRIKARCWAALKKAEMTFSADVTTGVDITSAPDLRVQTTEAA